MAQIPIIITKISSAFPVKKANTAPSPIVIIALTRSVP